MAPSVSRKDPFWEAGLRGKLEQKPQHWLVPSGSEGETPGPEASFLLGQPRARKCLWTLVQSYKLHLHFSKGTAAFL